MDFGQPNVEISPKMANDQLLFLALYICMYIVNYKILVGLKFNESHN